MTNDQCLKSVNLETESARSLSGLGVRSQNLPLKRTRFDRAKTPGAETGNRNCKLRGKYVKI